MIPYGTLVKVVAGFFLGCTGMVKGHNTTGDYAVALSCKTGVGDYDEQFSDLKENELKKISRKEWDSYHQLPLR